MGQRHATVKGATLFKLFAFKASSPRTQDYREVWLTFTKRLVSCRTATDIEKAILDTYGQFLGMKGALYVLDGDRQRYVLAGGPGDREGLPSFTPLTAYFLAREQVYSTDDHSYRPTAEEASFIRCSGAELIVPLISRASVLGLIALKKRPGSAKVTREDFDLMKTLANQAALAIANYRLADELVQVREMDAVAKLSSFVVHDLKNLAHTLTLVVNNARDYIAEPDFQKDMISSIMKTATRMKDIIQKIKVLPEIQDIRREPAEVDPIIREAIDEVGPMKPGVEIRYRPLAAVAQADHEELRKVIANLILNALEAMPDTGVVEVSTTTSDGTVFISVRDTGCGMAEEYVHHQLFKPFRTTKKKGLGIGLYQCKQIVEALRGSIEVQSEPGKGSTFTIKLHAGEKE
jgi:putative PEP-CTERM system histidine kinase